MRFLPSIHINNRIILFYFFKYTIIPECDASTIIKSCMSGDLGSVDFGSLNGDGAVSVSTASTA